MSNENVVQELAQKLQDAENLNNKLSAMLNDEAARSARLKAELDDRPTPEHKADLVQTIEDLRDELETANDDVDAMQADNARQTKALSLTQDALRGVENAHELCPPLEALDVALHLYQASLLAKVALERYKAQEGVMFPNPMRMALSECDHAMDHYDNSELWDLTEHHAFG